MRLYILAAVLLAFQTLTAQTPTWLRHAKISPDGDRIAFTYRGDLYTVPTEGGRATQLTYHTAHDYMATWSPDGQTLAFASDRYGNFDVYTMPAAGGAATRLTYHSNDELPYAFTPDGEHVVFGGVRQDAADHRQFPTGAQPELYTVPAGGGKIDLLLTVPAEHISYLPQGQSFLYHDKKGGEDQYRKHHVSSITRDIWRYDPATNTHTRLTTNPAEDRQPIASADGQTVYFLSERSGTFNVWKAPANAMESGEQLTDFDLHPVRFLSRANDGTIAFGHDGQLFTLREGEEPKKVAVRIVTQDVTNAEERKKISGSISEMAVSPDGKEIAFIAHGEVFVTSVGESFTRQLTETPERERFVAWGPEGKSVVYAREEAGNWNTYKTEKQRDAEPFFYAATLLKESPVLKNGKDNYLLEYSPDGKKMAWVEDRRKIKVSKVDGSEEVTLLDEDDLFHMRDGDKYFTWSPDSEWLLIDWSVLLNNSEILLMKADSSRRVNLTESGYYDSRPKWTADGKQMIWFSNRDGLKSYATSGQSERDVYTMFFTQEGWDEFNLSEEEAKLAKAVKEATKEKEKKEENKDKNKEKKDSTKVDTLIFEWDRLEEQTARLTIHSSRLGDAVLSKDGDKLYYLATFEKGANLWSTDLRTKETKMVMKIGRGGRLEWDKDRKNLYLLSGGSIAKLDVDKGKKTPVKIKGEVEIDADAERQVLFDHVWIRTKNIFYEPTFHGADWELMRAEYGDQLGGVSNNHEFAELLSEMLGELNVSHAGGRVYGTEVENPDATASLGIFADYAYTGDGIRVAEVVEGGPLDRSAFELEPGAVIVAIDGDTISSDRDPARYLNRKTGEFTLLSVRRPGVDTLSEITVKPISLGEEYRLLYKRWVKQNAKEVEERSGGKLGYVHIPSMSDGPYRDVYEDMLGKYRDREAMIVDTRFNRGGDLVADLAMFFTGVPFITYATEAKVVGGEPTSRWTKPTLALINEAQYSDGHCFAEGYSDLEIGTTLGMPTPGTCSFAGWERLTDKVGWGVVPISAKDIDGNWMENLQTEPDFMVKNMPGVIDAGRDQQLERAVEVMLEELEE